MFKPSDKDRKIRIKNTAGASFLSKGAVYKIDRVIDKRRVILENILDTWSAGEECYEFVSSLNESLKEGDKVVLINSTTSLKKGDISTVVSFINDDKRKVVIDGCLPGGWISCDKLTKAIDFNTNRVKKAIELWLEYGVEFVEILGLSKQSYSIIGKKLNELHPIQEMEIVSLYSPEGIKIYLPLNAYTDKPYEDLDFYIQEKYLYVSGSLSTPSINSILEYAGKSYSELMKGKFDPNNDKHVIKLADQFKSKSYVEIDQYIGNYACLKIKQKKNEQVQDSIPF